MPMGPSSRKGDVALYGRNRCPADSDSAMDRTGHAGFVAAEVAMSEQKACFIHGKNRAPSHASGICPVASRSGGNRGRRNKVRFSVDRAEFVRNLILAVQAIDRRHRAPDVVGLIASDVSMT